MSAVNSKRITFKRTRPNPLFNDWLEELYEEAIQKGSKHETILKEALSSISKYPLPLQSGAECAILKGFDKRLCLFLDKRLEVYRRLSNECVVDMGSKTSVMSVSIEENDIKPDIQSLENECKSITCNISQDDIINKCVDTCSKPSVMSVYIEENDIKTDIQSLENECKSITYNISHDIIINECVDTCSKPSIMCVSIEENDIKPDLQLLENENISISSGMSVSIEENYIKPEIDALENDNISIKSNTSPDINTNVADVSTSNLVIQNKKKRRYKPAFRSGTYALLMALVDLKKDQTMTKDQLAIAAQMYSKNAISSDGKNMTRLINKGLVKENIENNKSQYGLTDEGFATAKELFKHVQKKMGVKVSDMNDNIGSSTNNHVEYNGKVSEINDLLYDENVIMNSAPSNIKIFDSTKDHARPINSVRATLWDNCTDHNVIEKLDEHNDYRDLFEMKPGSFDIILLIDKNETSGLTKNCGPKITQFNKYPELKHEFRSLKVGDFTWIARDKRNKDHELVLPYVVERKRMDDLGNSIKDGRFHEQKFRLRKCGLNHIIYLVENYGSNKHVGLPMQSLMQALANTRVQDDFKVHITESLDHSVKFLATMTLRLIYEYKDKTLKGHSGEPATDLLMSFGYLNKSSVKNRPLSVTDTFIKLLLQLKGVSVEKALTITNVYKTPRLLIEKYMSCDQKEGEMLLANLKFGGMNRSVGPSVSRSVYQLFTFINIK